jgi:chemotaxis protein MotB
MMTMFILFLSLFVYQAAHKDFLVSDKTEVLGGETQETAQSAETTGRADFPFVVIKPAAPLLTTAGTIRKVEPITVQDIDLDTIFAGVEVDKTLEELVREMPVIAHLPRKPEKPAEKNREADSTPIESEKQTEPIAMVAQAPPQPAAPSAPPIPDSRLTEPEIPVRIASVELPKTVVQPLPLGMEPEGDTTVNDLFDQSRIALDSFDLNEFASIDLIPDKAVHIVLAGDLLFDSGQAALSEQAIYSLEKIAAVIGNTPHRIHIEGHTDDTPIVSGGPYANNRELSIARANAVAVFLIEDMGMNPDQFVISGYSSYHPVAPNTTAENKATNRRVEIVIAKTPEQPTIATLDFVQSPSLKL